MEDVSPTRGGRRSRRAGLKSCSLRGTGRVGRESSSMRLRPVTECRSGSDDDAVDSDCQRGAAAMAAAMCVGEVRAMKRPLSLSLSETASRAARPYDLPQEPKTFKTVRRTLRNLCVAYISRTYRARVAPLLLYPYLKRASSREANKRTSPPALSLQSVDSIQDTRQCAVCIEQAPMPVCRYVHASCVPLSPP